MRFDVLIDNYRQRRSGADDPQARMVQVGPVQVYFSYTTPVAFKVGSEPVVVRRNEWGPTTGSHLNAIDRGDRDDLEPAGRNVGGDGIADDLSAGARCSGCRVGAR